MEERRTMEDHTHDHSKHEDPGKVQPAGSSETPARVMAEQQTRHAEASSKPKTTDHSAHEMTGEHNPSLVSVSKMDHQSHYRRLLVMTVLSFVSMYGLMYAMVNVFGNVVSNLNQFYMAGLMTVPMVVIELLLMGGMYPNKRRNAVIITTSLVVGILLFIFIRQQTGITDKQFLRSMIPHHAGALLMCEQAPIANPEIQQLCVSILAGQQQEIDQMRGILDSLQQ
jgi:cation transport ATPase